MAPRANWKGYLTVGDLSCAVALYTAASTADRVSFHIINRRTGHRVHRQMVDSDTGRPVENENIVKGYEIGNGEYVVLDPDEVKAAVPEADKTLDLETFIPCGEVDTLFLDRPYYLAPTDKHAAEVFELIRRGLKESNTAAIARTVLFRRLRTLLIRPHDEGLIASTLNYDYEVRSSDEVFADIPEFKIQGEMLNLAKHIIGTKKGRFEPEEFHDRYEEALAELIKAKIEGRKIRKAPPPKETKVASLLDALRLSAGVGGDGGKAPPKTKSRSAASKSKSRGAAKSTRSTTATKKAS